MTLEIYVSHVFKIDNYCQLVYKVLFKNSLAFKVFIFLLQTGNFEEDSNILKNI